MPKKEKKEVFDNRTYAKKSHKKIASKPKYAKPSLKRHKKEIFRIIVVILVLLLIYFVAIFIFQLRSIYSEQIVMETNPQYIFLNIRQGDKENISIVTDIRTSFFCHTFCRYTFKDLSTGEIIEGDNFILSNYKNHLFETVLSTNRLGTGQEMYLFEISCRIKDSRMCSSTRFPVTRTSLVTLNYGLSEEQQENKNKAVNKMNLVARKTYSAQSNLLSAKATVDNLSEMKTDYLYHEIDKLSFFNIILEKDIELVNEFWKTQNYSFVREEISKRNVLEKAIYFEQISENLLSLIDLEKEIHNRGIILLNEMEEKLPLLKELKQASLLGKVTKHNLSLSKLYDDTLSLYYLMNQNSFVNYQDLYHLIEEIENTSAYLYNYYKDNLLKKENLFYEFSIWNSLLENDLCLLQRNGDSCNNLIRLPENNFSNISEILLYSNLVCDELMSLKEYKYNLIKRQELTREEMSEQEMKDIDKEKALVESSMIHWQIQQLSNNRGLARNILRSYSLNILNGTFQDVNYYPEEYDKTKKIGFLPAKYLEYDSKYFFNACIPDSFHIPEISTNIEKGEIIHVSAERIVVSQDVPATCCFNSVCEDCCDSWSCKEDLRNPLILLHGYSFYSFNSAFHSTNAYNDFVKAVLDEDLYYPAGIIGPAFHPEYEIYDLSRTFVPPVFKATYYDVLRFEEIRPGQLNIKSQSIEDYGDRLNDLIEYVKSITGKSEVDIVAHSMGGLVTRSYIDKYGDDSLGKIILMGTPNKGVPRRLLHLCRFFGGKTECTEMYEKSDFINYLNSEANLPSKEVHMIVGEGCSTFGRDGDGVVQTRSAVLDFAENYFFKGSCDLIDNFHRDMNKPSRYSEIYELIKEILLS